MSRQPHSARRRARTGSVVAALTAMALGVLATPGASAHDAETTFHDPYTPPPVSATGPVSGAYTNVAHRDRHEVWVVDQSNTAPTSDPTFGGRIHIYDGSDLRRNTAAAQAEVVELGGATADLCREETGVNPVRPHMVYFNSTHSHAVLAFVASGHVAIIDAATREPAACFRSETGAGGAVQAHAAVPTPDDRYVIVANQNGKKVERIRTDYAAGVFDQEPAATIDLTTGEAPTGDPVQTPDDPTVRPDNAPICPFVPSSGYPALISLRGGGLLALDPYATPMKIVADYPATQVARDGCGFTESQGWVYGNGGRTPGTESGWFVYRVPVGGPDLWNPIDQPQVELVEQDARGPRDAHGMVTVRDRYVWAFDRSAHVLQVYEGRTGGIGMTTNLRSPWAQSPAPDIVAQSPDGRAVYAATRGPNPLSGAHAATGDAPGLMVLEVRKDGREGVVRGHVAISNRLDGREDADPHGLAVRRSG